MLGSEFLIIIAPQAPFLPLFWCASESNSFWCGLFKYNWDTSYPAHTRFNSTPFGHFCSLIAEIRLSSGTETFYSHVINKMSTTEDLSSQPYMFEPESEPERDENEDDEPVEQRLHMDVSQWCVTVFTHETLVFRPFTTVSIYFD